MRITTLRALLLVGTQGYKGFSALKLILAVWKSLESQNDWAKSEQGAAVQANMQAMASGPVYHDVVVFTEDVEPTLAAEAVELVSWIHPSSSIDQKKMSDVEQGFKIFQKAISTQAPESDKGLVGGWGQEFDYNGTPSRRWTALIGWKSVQAHYDCKKTAIFTENIHWLMDYGHSEVEMVHFSYAASLEK